MIQGTENEVNITGIEHISSVGWKKDIIMLKEEIILETERARNYSVLKNSNKAISTAICSLLRQQ